MGVSGIDEQRQMDQYLPRQCSLGTDNKPRELWLHSAANVDGCWYQRQGIVGLLRNAREAGTMWRWKDAIISVVCYLATDNIYQYLC